MSLPASVPSGKPQKETLLFYVVHTVESSRDVYSAMPTTWVSLDLKTLYHPPDQYTVNKKAPFEWGLATFQRHATPDLNNIDMTKRWVVYKIASILNFDDVPGMFLTSFL